MSTRDSVLFLVHSVRRHSDLRNLPLLFAEPCYENGLTFVSTIIRTLFKVEDGSNSKQGIIKSSISLPKTSVYMSCLIGVICYLKALVPQIGELLLLAGQVFEQQCSGICWPSEWQSMLFLCDRNGERKLDSKICSVRCRSPTEIESHCGNPMVYGISMNQCSSFL